jgi:catechol 2,3-dioxygenase-like lactoylglutathione lyase family enzyme
MKALRLAWLGIRSDDYDATVGLFRDVLGLEVAFEEERTVELQFPAGERVQVFAPGHAYHAHFSGHALVPLVEVDDLPAAEARVRDAGLEIVRRGSDSAWEWFELLGADGHLYSIGARRG